MNWEAIGAVGELLGALGVIVTLGYLAVQIRQNTRVVKATGYHAVNAATLPRDVSVIENPDVARLLVEGLSGRELSPEDFVRFHTFLHSVFRFFDSMYYQYRNQTLDSEHWETHREAMRRWLANPSLRAWWDAFQNTFTPSFRELVVREIQAIEQPPSADA